MQKVLGKRDACGGGGTVDTDDLCALADGLTEEVQFLWLCVCGQDRRSRMQSKLVGTSLLEWGGSIRMLSSLSDIILSHLLFSYWKNHPIQRV